MKPDWLALELEYIQGNESLKEVADRTGINYDTVRTRANRAKWNEKRNSLNQRVAESVIKKIEKTRADEIAEFNKFTLALSKKVLNKVKDGLEKNSADPKELRAYAASLQTVQTVGRLSLGLDKDDSDNDGTLEILGGLN